MSREIKFNSGYNDCNDMIAILKNESVPRDLKDFESLKEDDITEDTYLYIDNNGVSKKVSLSDIQSGMNRVQSDFDVDDVESPSFIKNKDHLVGVLQAPITTLHNVGGIKANTTYPTGTPLERIIRELLSAVGDAVVYFKVSNSIPTNFSVGEYETISTTKERLTIEGLTVNHTYSNQYYILVVPHSLNLEVDKVLQAGWPTEFSVNKEFNNGSCDMYYYNLPITGSYSIKYTFKETN